MRCRRQKVSAPGRSMCFSRVTADNYLRWMQLGGGDCGMRSVGSKPCRYPSVRGEGHLPHKRSKQYKIPGKFWQASGDGAAHLFHALRGLVHFVIWGVILKKTEKKTMHQSDDVHMCSLHDTFVRLDLLQTESISSRTKCWEFS